jgi:hypothetical protein
MPNLVAVWKRYGGPDQDRQDVRHKREIHLIEINRIRGRHESLARDLINVNNGVAIVPREPYKDLPFDGGCKTGAGIYQNGEIEK